MASKEDAFIQEHFPFAMSSHEQRVSGDEQLFPDMNSTIYRMSYVR
jgi:hypothetical protein